MLSFEDGEGGIVCKNHYLWQFFGNMSYPGAKNDTIVIESNLFRPKYGERLWHVVD